MVKQLEKNSEFNKFDTDHDGVVTDAELARSERMITIENMDKMAAPPWERLLWLLWRHKRMSGARLSHESV